eukprot:SAG25_NODE_4063_length_898_cov_3.359199_2_plen_44_part_00
MGELETAALDSEEAASATATARSEREESAALEEMEAAQEMEQL